MYISVYLGRECASWSAPQPAVGTCAHACAHCCACTDYGIFWFVRRVDVGGRDANREHYLADHGTTMYASADQAPSPSATAPSGVTLMLYLHHELVSVRPATNLCKSGLDLQCLQCTPVQAAWLVVWCTSCPLGSLTFKALTIYTIPCNAHRGIVVCIC